jgi:WD40 repeat protein
VAPTATPLFPEPAISADNLATLRLLRTIGVGALQDASVAPAGRLLAVATTVGLALFELPSLQLVRFERREAHQVALSPDGRLLVVDLELLRVADGGRIATLGGAHPRFSPDGRFITTIDTAPSRTVHIWRSADGKELSAIPGQLAAFNHDGTLLAVSGDTGIQLLDLPSGFPVRTLAIAPNGKAQDMAFGAGGQTLLLVAASELQEWRIADGQRIRSLPIVHTNDPSLLQIAGEVGEYVELSPAGDIFASVFVEPGEGLSLSLQLRNTADGQLIGEQSSRQFDSDHFRFSADGTAAVGTTDSSLKLNPNALTILGLPSGTTTEVKLPAYTGLIFSPDAQTLATVSIGPSNAAGIDLWRVTDGVLQQTLDPPCLWGTYDLLFSPDGRQLAGRCSIDPPYGDHTEELVVWDLGAGGQLRTRWNDYFSSIRAFSPAGALLATKDTSSYLADATTGVTIPLSLPADVGAAAFSLDGAMLAIGDRGGMVRLLDASGKARADTLQAGGPVNGLFFSPDGSLLAIRREDGLVQVWRPGQAAPVARLAAAADDLLIFTADNNMIIAGGKSGVTFYRVTDGNVLRKLDVAAQAIAIGPRRRLLAILHDGQVELWGVGP